MAVSLYHNKNQNSWPIKKEKSNDTWLGMNYFININLETNETNIEMLDERI